MLREGGGFGSSGDTSMTGGEGLGATEWSGSPCPISGEFLFRKSREVGADSGVDKTAGVVVVSDTFCWGCLPPIRVDFSFPAGATGS